MKAVVTGGGGFLGAEIVRLLRARGDAVVVVGRGRYPAIEALGARCTSWDLSEERPGLDAVFEGADIVFHTAARAGVWGPEAEFRAINVDGTRRVIQACRAARVPALVYTSSPSATFDGGDAEGLREADCPYPATFEAFYPATKAEAERLVLAANSPELRTTCLRPHLIYGPGDPHLLPRLLARAKQGRLARVGDGKNRVGITFVTNAAAAHVQAGDALRAGRPNAGRAYFITDPEPVVLWDWINAVLAGVGVAPVTRHVSRATARTLGSVLETIWRLFGLGGEPPMTRFVASQLAISHWYDLTGATEDFGYAPPVSGEEGMARTITALRSSP